MPLISRGVISRKEPEMDYNELINQLKALERHTGFCVLKTAANVIETLLAERDAARNDAMELQVLWDMYGGDEGITAAFQKAEERDAAVDDLKKICEENTDACQYCKNLPCMENHGRCIGWEWRGAKKGEF